MTPAAVEATDDLAGNFHRGPELRVSAMRICIDGRMLDVDGTGTGVATYARTLIETLRRAGVAPATLHAGVAYGGRNQALPRVKRWARAATAAPRFASDGDDSMGERMLVARDVFREGQVHFNMYRRLMPVHCEGPPGVMHWTYPVPLYMAGWRNIYTVHDVIPLAGDRMTTIRAGRHRALLGAIAKRADRLVAVSYSARDDIARTLGCHPDFVAMTSQATALSLGDAAMTAAGHREDFLFCGTIEPRKNLERLVAGLRASGSPRRLVIAGPDGWQAERIKRAIAGPDVEFVGYQPREQLIERMRHARAILFPSLSEGFGLPVVEAMALGTPVMTSGFGALDEIAGDAALKVDPLAVDQMATSIAKLCEDDLLCDSLGTQGLARAMDFTTARYADRLTSCYAELMAG